MLLRNKKTGEIKEVEPITIGGFRSLAELNAEWEDYEETKGIRSTSASYGDKRITIEFSSREETVEAYEKLRAWKRLKDKGFRFCGGDDACISYEADIENWSMQDLQDFDLLFGGEE